MKRILLTLTAIILILLAAAAITFYRAPLWLVDQRTRLHLRAQHVQSNYIVVDGYNLHYFEAVPQHAKDDGTPIVLIHGLGARGEDWAAMIPSLAAAGFHVYAPDLLGYGRSPKPDIHYTIAEQEKIVGGFMRAMHLTRADVGGWSMGGWIALKFTLDNPSLVRRLVVYDAAGVYFPATFDETLFTPADAAGLYHLEEMLTPKPMHLPAFIARDAIRKLQANAWVIDRSVRSMVNGRDLLDFQLHRIQQPTLIVWGAQDRLIPLASGEKMHRQIAGSNLLVVQGCGHLAPAECTAPILNTTIAFLKAVPPPQGREVTLAGH